MLDVPKRDRRAERREATRREIVHAAWEVAHDKGLAAMTLRDVAERVGMRAPSLYSHFDSKLAIVDAMFGQAWADFLDVATAAQTTLPNGPRAALLYVARTFFEYSVADFERHRLMNKAVLPGFHPSAESYAPAVEVLERLRGFLAGLHVDVDVATDLFTAITSGLIDQQMANDPEGERWKRLLPQVIDMYADHLNLPGPRLQEKP